MPAVTTGSLSRWMNGQIGPEPPSMGTIICSRPYTSRAASTVSRTKGSSGSGGARALAAQVSDLHVAESLCVQVRAQLTQDVLRVLIRHEPEIHFRAGLRGQHRLRAFALIAGGQPTDGAGGDETRLALVFEAPGDAFEEPLQPVRPLVVFGAVGDFG